MPLVARLLIASQVVLAACSSERPPPPASERAPDATPFFCHDKLEICFPWPQACFPFIVGGKMLGPENEGECVEVPRAWCFRREDAYPRSADPNWECWASEKRCREVLSQYRPDERCFLLDDSRILERHVVAPNDDYD